MLSAIICSLLLAGLASAHPQCLTFYPPYTPSGQFQLCTDYKDFGCCGDDRHIVAQYNAEMGRLSTANRLKCSMYLKNVLCQVCSPYAAHLYDAETSAVPKEFPSLCPDYLIEMLTQCMGVVMNLNVSLPLPIPDRDYCYPNILNDTTLNQGLGSVQTSNQGNCIKLCVKEVVNDIFTPTAGAAANDGTHRFFVAEQRGVIWVFLKNFTRLSPPFLDIQSAIYSSGRAFDERGLLDLVFHPNYKSNGLFYILYSTRFNGRHMSRISEFKVSRDMNIASRNTERVVLDLPQPATNHNGGKLLFREGLLYIFTGDGGKGGDPFGHGQNKASLLGKVLRIDVDNRSDGESYTIPPDNPFIFTPGAKPEIYAYGLRNPWRCSKDRGDPETGEGADRIFCGDVGQDKLEEVDVIKKGRNYGWNGFEGNSCFNRAICSNINDHEPPITEYNHATGKSITGGYVYRGCESPNLAGLYLFADWSNGQLFYLKEFNGSWHRGRICMGGDDVCVNGGIGNTHVKFITSFAEDESGEIYILGTNYAEQANFGGRVYKLLDPSRGGNPLKCASVPTQETTFGSDAQAHPYTPITENSLSYRLVGDLRPDRGRVEIRRGNGAWGTICDDHWGRREADVVCRALGFRISVAARGRAYFGRGSGPIHLDNLRCTGAERSLLECPHRGWGKHDCSHREDASVICGGPVRLES